MRIFYGLVRVLADMQACEMFIGRMGKREGVYDGCVAEDTRDARVWAKGRVKS